MKELKYSLLVSVILQVVLWGVFTIIDEFISPDSSFALIVGLLLCLLLIVLYFICAKKIIAKYKLKTGLFKVILFVIWGLLSIGMTFLMSYLVEQGILQECDSEGLDCFLGGIEYIFLGMFMLSLETIITFIELIINGIKLIKYKMKAKN